MILRKLADAITEQNWFTVVLEILIVVVGVYVGIYIGEAADERALRADVNSALGVLHVQLREDLVNLDLIIENQTLGREAYQEALDVLNGSPVDTEALTNAIARMGSFDRTFFPNRSAYQSMRDLGYLAEVRDARLQLLVTSLFERFYQRQDANAASHDSMVLVFQNSVRDAYWDRYGEKFINDDPEGVIRLRNGIRTLRGTKGYYLAILTNDVRPGLVGTIDALSAYLQEQSK